MSRNQLIEAYQSGRISRRSFIRGMAALGLSASMATAFADDLRAAPAKASRLTPRSDVYDDVYELPATGSGQIDTSGSAWVKPLALVGAAAALVAGGARRLRGGENTAE